MTTLPPTSQAHARAHALSLVEALCARLDDAVLVVCGADRRVLLANGPARLLLADPSSPHPDAGSGLADYRIALMVDACLARGGEVRKELVDPVAERHMQARAFPLTPPDPDNDTPPDIAIVLRDETRLRRLETVRRDFVANVSHELRTPIAAIQLLVETLQEGALADIEVASEFVGKIALEVAHMTQMVSELLELSTIESGQRPLQLRAVPAAYLVGAAERLRPLADERQLAMVLAVDDGTPPIHGDASRLAQVVRNLVHNAIKFTPPGGSVEMLAATATDPGFVEIRVCDTGVGISPEEASRIFERFWKADSSRQRDGEGSGLGLAIARHVVEAHGGRIAVAANAGRPGSTFVVTLPAAHAAMPEAAATTN